MVGFSDGYLSEKEEDLFRNRIKTDYPATEWAYIWRILKGEDSLKEQVNQINLKMIERKQEEIKQEVINRIQTCQEIREELNNMIIDKMIKYPEIDRKFIIKEMDNALYFIKRNEGLN
jgi:hypothetical protein